MYLSILDEDNGLRMNTIFRLYIDTHFQIWQTIFLYYLDDSEVRRNLATNHKTQSQTRVISPLQPLVSLYRPSNYNYPVYYSAVLLFVITIVVPLTLGLTQLPLAYSTLVFAVGFISLFMLVRNEEAGVALLTFLRIRKTEDHSKKFSYFKTNRYDKHKINSDDNEANQIPFELVQARVEQMVATHEDHIDLATRKSLVTLCEDLKKMAHE